MDELIVRQKEYLTQQARNVLKRTAQDIIDLSQICHEYHETFGYQEYIRWVKEDLGISETMGRRALNVYDEFGCTANLAVRDLQPSVLYLLAAPSTPESARQEAIEKAESGEALTHKQAQELIKAHKEIEAKEARIDDLEEAIAALQARLPTKDVIEKIQELTLALEAEKNRPPVEIEKIVEVIPDDYEETKESLVKVQDALKGTRSQVKKLTKEYETLLKKFVSPEDLPEKKYKTIVVDPPWPVQKIVRDVRPQQDVFDYPVMSLEEISDFPIEKIADADCHLYLWTTQKFLPDAIRILKTWGFSYQCLMTWVKNVGMTPYSWMYSTEHVLFGRRGSLDLLKMGVRLDFHADVTGHSQKPDVFYEVVETVSPEPRIDVFSRKRRDGFDQFGNEKDKFNGSELEDRQKVVG